MGKPYKRGDIYWFDLIDSTGERVYRSTGQRDLRNAERVRAEVLEAVANNARVKATPQTVAEFAEVWAEGRKKKWSWKNDLRNLKNNFFDEKIDGAPFGRMKLVTVRSQHIRELVERLQDPEKDFASRTVLNNYGALRLLFKAAVTGGKNHGRLIEQTPCVLEDGALPVVADKDPEWRNDAEYTRDEVEQLISDDRLAFRHRVWWALGLLTGMRAGEVAALRWRHYDAAQEPIGRLGVNFSYTRQNKVLKGTKTERPRVVPVHPTLAAILAEWHLAGWLEFQGRAPKPDDLILPNAHGRYLTDNTTRHSRPENLATLGLRLRRFHDARATFITLGTMDGGEEVWLERCTHNAKGNQFNQYRRAHWPKLCEAVLCLKIQRRTGTLIPLKALGTDGAVLQSVLQSPVSEHNPQQSQPVTTWAGRDSKLSFIDQPERLSPVIALVSVSVDQSPTPTKAEDCRTVVTPPSILDARRAVLGRLADPDEAKARAEILARLLPHPEWTR